MKFQDLNDLIPFCTGKINHVLTLSPYNAVTIATPGRHQNDTAPVGGDFLVMVSDAQIGWCNHQFTHEDIFQDIEKKTRRAKRQAAQLMEAYARIVVDGDDPATFEFERTPGWTNTLHPQTFLYAIQCLAVCESRRYGEHEAKQGGKYLPARFASGIVEGLWTAQEASQVSRSGRNGLDNLAKVKGKPVTLRRLVAV